MTINAVDRTVGRRPTKISTMLQKEELSSGRHSRVSNPEWKPGRTSLHSNVGKVLLIFKRFFYGGGTQTRLQGLRREIENEEMDDIDILPNSIVVLYPIKRKYSCLSAYSMILSHLMVQHLFSFCLFLSVIWILDSLGHFACSWPRGLPMGVVGERGALWDKNLAWCLYNH